MKLEVGKSYVSRNGVVYGPMRYYGNFWGSDFVGLRWRADGSSHYGPDSHFDLIHEHKPKPEGQTLTMSLDLSDMRNEMERLNRATKAFLEEYDRD